jgi:hypothetical protein
VSNSQKDLKVAKIDVRNDPIIEKDSIFNKTGDYHSGCPWSKTRYVQAANTTRRDEPNGEKNEGTRHTAKAITTTVQQASQSTS